MSPVAPGFAPAAPSRSPLAGPGRVLFRVRGWLYLPFALFALFCFRGEWEQESAVWPLGLALMAAGATLRYRCIRHMGGAARTHKDRAKRLVRDGPYAWVRNPLYIANLAAFLGFVLLCELAWFLPVAGLLLLACYHAIARYEETVMEASFPGEFPAYRASTPMWLLRPPGRRPGPAPDLYPSGKVLRRERGAILNLAGMIALAAVKELLLHPL